MGSTHASQESTQLRNMIQILIALLVLGVIGVFLLKVTSTDDLKR